LLPGYLGALVDRVRAALQKFPAAVSATVPSIFSAHSLPERILSWNEPYPDELRATVAAVMERLGPHPHEFAFQSAAISNEPWLGPDVGAALDRLAAECRKYALIAPIDFVVEHVEILHDIEAAHALFKQFPVEIAAVIVEPVAGNMGVVPPT
jgi:protoporphyrin/coproporphyrin ferrochelatase